MAYAGSVVATLNGPGEEATMPINAWDTASIPGGAWRSIANVGDTDAELVVITSGDGRKTPEWAPEVLEAVKAKGMSVDKSGFIAPAHLLPVYAMGKQ